LDIAALGIGFIGLIISVVGCAREAKIKGALLNN
jgi:hypothetical protein